MERRKVMEVGKVSVITPCYNGEKYIEETILSVVAQTYENWELIVVDDGSTDNSAEVVQAYCEADDRIRYFKQQNAGSAVARNKGIDICVGQYIALLDADDIWLPTFLEKQIEFMKSKNAICVCCAYSRINAQSEGILRVTTPPEIITYKKMMKMNYIGCLTGLYDISKHGKVFLREEYKSVRDDYAYWADIVKFAGEIYGNQEILARYRVLEGSTTGNKKKLIKKQYQFYRKYFGLNCIQSCINVLQWGIAGLQKFG